jgi:hypothetical protein
LAAYIQGSNNEMIDEDTTKIFFRLAMLFTMIGMGTMIIAFITGTYVVLEPSLGLAISTCLIGLSFFVFLVFRLIFKQLLLNKAFRLVFRLGYEI